MSARFTPYELAFGPPDFESEVFPGILDEMRPTGPGLPDPDAFLRLEAVGRTLREMEGRDEPRSLSALEMREHARLLFHGFRFWAAHRPIWVLDDRLTRELLESLSPVGEWPFAAPAPAGYLQLGRRIVWARTSEDAPAESVDGAFWAVSPIDPARSRSRVDILLVLGMHPDRPGFSAVDVTGWLPLPPPGHWADGKVRSDEPDFANVLPGGDLRGLFALISGAEVMKLMSRVFHYLATHRSAVGEPGIDPGAPSPSRLDLPPSALAARRVSASG
jgi:hypothetical protein